jgi:hypothetical protein
MGWDHFAYFFKPEYAGALLGFKDFSHAVLVTYLHQAHYKDHGLKELES